jgi:AcrR family transcriptional regulator
MEQELNTTQSKSELQNEILIAALKLFADKGYFNTSLTDIAQASGLKSVSALYQYFSGKQDIANKLYENILDNLNVSIDDIRRRSQKASEQLRGVVDLFFKLTDDAPSIMRFLLLMPLNEFLPDQKPLSQTPAFSKILKIIQSGIRAGEIRNIDPMLANAYFFGIINNTLRMALAGELNKSAEACRPQTWLAAWNMIAKKSSVF